MKHLRNEDTFGVCKERKLVEKERMHQINNQLITITYILAIVGY